MGVLSCGRDGCHNIMCDRSVQTDDGWHYICDDCYAGLLSFKAMWPKDMAERRCKEKDKGIHEL